MKYLLDTNTCIRFLNGRAPQIRVKMATVADSAIAISTVTQGEMYAGSAKSQHPRQSRAKQDAFFVRFVKLPFDELAANEFGHIRACEGQITHPTQFSLWKSLNWQVIVSAGIAF